MEIPAGTSSPRFLRDFTEMCYSSSGELRARCIPASHCASGTGVSRGSRQVLESGFEQRGKSSQTNKELERSSWDLIHPRKAEIYGGKQQIFGSSQGWSHICPWALAQTSGAEGAGSRQPSCQWDTEPREGSGWDNHGWIALVGWDGLLPADPGWNHGQRQLRSASLHPWDTGKGPGASQQLPGAWSCLPDPVVVCSPSPAERSSCQSLVQFST